MIRARIAHRYTRALFELARDSGAMEQVGTDLDEVQRLIFGDEMLRTALLSPVLTRPAKSQIIDALIAAANPQPLIANFLRVLLDARKLLLLPDITAAYKGMADGALGRVRGETVTATTADETDLRAISQALSKTLRKEVLLDARTDPSILGGVVARVGNLVFDASLRTQLQKMSANLTKG